MSRVDIAIIGAGPAGISAAINAKIRNKSFILFGTDSVSHKVQVSKEINNYIGIPAVTGVDLNNMFTEHLNRMNIEITNETITGIYNMGKYYMLLADRKEFEATCVIIATGAETVKPITNERELLGKGVSYCATCDGNLYKGKKIAVFCDVPTLEDEVEYLAELADTVYYYSSFKSDYERENVVKLESKITAINGENRVSSVTLKDGQEIEVAGIFFLKQAVAADVLLRGLETDNGRIIVDREMKTNIKGCFAAGDCVGTPYQIAKAVGEGNIALHSAVAYLSKKE